MLKYCREFGKFHKSVSEAVAILILRSFLCTCILSIDFGFTTVFCSFEQTCILPAHVQAV